MTAPEPTPETTTSPMLNPWRPVTCHHITAVTPVTPGQDRQQPGEWIISCAPIYHELAFRVSIPQHLGRVPDVGEQILLTRPCPMSLVADLASTPPNCQPLAQEPDLAARYRAAQAENAELREALKGAMLIAEEEPK